MIIADGVVADFQRDGVVVVRGVFRDWVSALAGGVAEVMTHPSLLERSYQPKEGSAAFFQDYCNWSRIPAFRAFIFESPAAELAGRLMNSSQARFFHDHVLVKRPGNSTGEHVPLHTPGVFIALGRRRRAVRSARRVGVAPVCTPDPQGRRAVRCCGIPADLFRPLSASGHSMAMIGLNRSGRPD